MENNWLHDSENYLIYFGDTMCSWCYGFAEELSALRKMNTAITLKVVNGGLRPHGTQKNGDRIPEFDNQLMGEFLRHHWKEVEKRSGQPFTYEILDDPDFIYDTEPAARACVTARIMNPAVEFDFFKAVQHAFYAENKDTNSLSTFLPIAEKFELDITEFAGIFNSDDSKALTNADFQLSTNMGVRGFPSLVLKQNQAFFLIANGYQKAHQVQAIIDRIQSEKIA